MPDMLARILLLLLPTLTIAAILQAHIEPALKDLPHEQEKILLCHSRGECV